MKLSSANVEAILTDCLFTEAEASSGLYVEVEHHPDVVLVEGVMTKFGFHRPRLESHRADVISMLAEVDDAFKLGKGGGGMSLLQLPFTKTGDQWGEQRDGDHLYCIAAGLDLAVMPLPRPMWNILPGGLPYITFKVEA